jgi:hypothetical protein
MPIANLGSPIIFMHERFSPSGKRYLVVLHGMNGEDASLMACPVGQIGVNVDLWEPAALDVPPKSANYLGDPFGTRLLDGSIVKRLRVFAGQADPNDPTHFVIRFEEDGQPGIIDGYVCDGNVANGSSVYGDSVAHVKLIERPAN